MQAVGALFADITPNECCDHLNLLINIPKDKEQHRDTTRCLYVFVVSREQGMLQRY